MWEGTFQLVGGRVFLLHRGNFLRVIFPLLSLGVIGGGDLQNGIHHHVKVRLPSSEAPIEALIHMIESSWVYFIRDGRVFFSPGLKNLFEVWTSLNRFIHRLHTILIQIILHRISSHHQVQQKGPIMWVITRITYNILDSLCMVGDNSISYIPLSFSDQITQENDFNLIEKEYFADGFEYFTHRILC